MSDWIGEEGWWDGFLLSKCRKQVEQSDFDHAIRDAFICVEERIREISGVDGYGTNLINRVFNDKRTDFARRILRRGINLEKARFFVDGAFGLFRNKPSHRFVGNDRETCIAVLRTANLILRLIEKGRATVDDLWYEVRHPEETVAADVSCQSLLNENPVRLRDLLTLRSEGINNGKQQVVDLVDNAVRNYLESLRRKQEETLLRTLTESLLQTLNNGDEELNVRIGAAFYLQFLPYDDVRMGLGDFLSRTDEYPEGLVISVIDTLAALGGSVGRRTIVTQLVRSPTPGIRSAAIVALGQVEYAEESITTLLDLFDELAWPDKERAIDVFRNLKARETVPKLEACLSDDSWSVQIAACEALGEFAEPQSALPLGELLLAAPNPQVRRAAALALTRVRTDKSIEYLEHALVVEEAKEERMQDKSLLDILSKGLRTIYQSAEGI